VIGTGRALSLWQMAVLAFEVAKVSTAIYLKVDRDDNPGPRPLLIADPAKARAAFGFAPETTVEQLIEMIVRHYLEHPEL